ncbi:MAG: M60 family metallopeptidase [Akkermansia sp.]
MKILPILSVFVLTLNGICAEKLDIPAPKNVPVETANSTQTPYSGLHAIRQSVNGSTSDNNWHVTKQDFVEGEYLFYKGVSLDLIQFEHPSFNEVELEVYQGAKHQALGKIKLDQSGSIRFPKRLQQVQGIKIKIDCRPSQFFSLSEVRFLIRDTSKLEQLVTKVFTDTSCSKLRDNYSSGDYYALPKLLQSIEADLKHNRYKDKEFRIASYKAYSPAEAAADIRHINPLNKFDNPTGIYAKKGEMLYVFVGPSHGQTVSLASVKPYSMQASNYPLFEGLNQIKISETGLLYVMYHTDLSSKPQPQPITIHIPKDSGRVNGYFDIRRHNDQDWKKLIKNADAEVFDILGRYSMMTLDTKALQKHSPNGITQSVRMWDESMRAIWRVQGFHKYKQAINNRQYGFSIKEGPHMFSTSYGCGYSVGADGVTLRDEVIAPGIAIGNRLWGIGHEVGHSNQALINWPSMTESSNNMFAQVLLDQVCPHFNGGVEVSDMENPCKYLLEEAVLGKPFHDLNGWAKWGFAQYSFYLYFHKLGINPDFYPDLFESLRQSPLRYTNDKVAEAHIQWYERICNSAKIDFTEDFETFNWFVPCDISAHQYGDYRFHLTQGMADDAKARIAAKNYPKPKYRIAFMHQHTKEVDLWGLKLKGCELNGYWKKYQANAKLSPKVSARKEGNMITIAHGENAAAFCIKTDGKIVGYYDRPQFDISSIKWNESSELYAIPIQTAEPLKKLEFN